MSFLRRLFGGGSEDSTGTHPETVSVPDAEPLVGGPVSDGDPSLQRVVAWLPLADPAFETSREQQRMFRLEDRLMRGLYESGAGDLDTNELDRGYYAMRFQGRDAHAIVRVLLPLLDEVPRGAYLAVRAGPYGAAEERIDLPADPDALADPTGG